MRPLILLLPLLRAATAVSIPVTWTNTNLEGKSEEMMMMMDEGRRGAISESAMAGGREVKGILTTRDSKVWQIRGLTRCTSPYSFSFPLKPELTSPSPPFPVPDFSKNTTEWQFTLLDTETNQETPCSVTSPIADPIASFYGVPCAAGDNKTPFKISWGYNPTADSAVMTVC